MTTYNTGNPIGSKDPRDLYDNAENLDVAVNDDAATWVDRLGVQRSTLWQMLEYSKQFNDRGDWHTSTAYARKDYFTYGGVAYVTLTAHTSTSVAADLAAGKIGVMSGNSGAMDFLQAGTGAVARSVQSKLRDVVSITDFGAKGDGGDDTGAINAAIQHVGSLGGGEVVIPNGTFGITRIFIKWSNVVLRGCGPNSELRQIGTAPANFAGSPTGLSIWDYPSAAITIAPPDFVWGNNQDPEQSTVGAIGNIFLFDFRLTGWWNSAPAPYDGYNTNMTGQPYNDRSGGIFGLCTLEIHCRNLIITKMGAENFYCWNGKVSSCYIVSGGEVGLLGRYSHLINSRIQNSYNQAGVGARLVSGNHIFGMANSGIYIGGSSHESNCIVTDNYISDCNGYSLFITDDGSFDVAKRNYLISNNVFVGKTGQTANTTVFIDIRNQYNTLKFSNNFVIAPQSTSGIMLGPCQGKFYLSDNVVTGNISGATANGIDFNNIGVNAEIYVKNNNVEGFANNLSPAFGQTFTNPKLIFGMNSIGDEAVINGTNTHKAQSITNLIVNQNIINRVIADVASNTVSPVADCAFRQYQYLTGDLVVNPPSGYQPGQRFILELLNASGANGTVTINAGTAPAAYKGTMNAGQAVNGGQRVIIEMVYLTNTWLELSKALI